jgi:methylglutaconyl-CoA hydratase
MSQSTHGRSNNKENEGKEAQRNGFVTTRKSRIAKPNAENSLDMHRQQQILLECPKGRGMTSRDGEKDAAVKRKVLSEVSNLEHPDVIGVTGKWKCPQKSKPNLGPPMKQLRLERWVHRL